MKILMICLALAAGRPAVERIFDTSLNATERAGACFELRGVKDEDTVAAMRRAMDDAGLLSCAADNLRLAGAVGPLREALASENEQVRAAAARELGRFQRIDLLEPLAHAAEDSNMLVATNAIAALAEYTDPAVIPYLATMAKNGGMTGDMAIDRLAVLDRSAALDIARQLLGSSQVPDQLYAMRILGAYGDGTDLDALKKIAASGQEDLAQRGRGFGFMPPISLARAAETAMQKIEARSGTKGN